MASYTCPSLYCRPLIIIIFSLSPSAILRFIIISYNIRRRPITQLSENEAVGSILNENYVNSNKIAFPPFFNISYIRGAALSLDLKPWLVDSPSLYINIYFE